MQDVYDLVRNVGVETIYNNIFNVIDKKMNSSREELKEIISSKPITDLKSIVKKTAVEIKEFINYCNKQFEIIGVSHNCTLKCIYLKSDRIYQRFNFLDSAKGQSGAKLTGYMQMKKYSLINKKKSTIKNVKEYYSKS